MRLTGYSDIWSTRPGDDIRFHIHAEAPTYTAELIRLQHGDESPYGPGHKSTNVASAIDGTHPGQQQRIYKGSYATAALEGLNLSSEDLALSCWIWPTLPGPDKQGIIGIDGGLPLLLDENGVVCAASGDAVLSSDVRLSLREWYHLTARQSDSELSLTIRAGRWQPGFDAPLTVTMKTRPRAALAGPELLIAALERSGRAASGLLTAEWRGRRFCAATNPLQSGILAPLPRLGPSTSASLACTGGWSTPPHGRCRGRIGRSPRTFRPTLCRRPMTPSISMTTTSPIWAGRKV